VAPEVFRDPKVPVGSDLRCGPTPPWRKSGPIGRSPPNASARSVPTGPCEVTGQGRVSVLPGGIGLCEAISPCEMTGLHGANDLCRVRVPRGVIGLCGVSGLGRVSVPRGGIDPCEAINPCEMTGRRGANGPCRERVPRGVIDLCRVIDLCGVNVPPKVIDVREPTGRNRPCRQSGQNGQSGPRDQSGRNRFGPERPCRGKRVRAACGGKEPSPAKDLDARRVRAMIDLPAPVKVVLLEGRLGRNRSGILEGNRFSVPHPERRSGRLDRWLINRRLSRPRPLRAPKE
jgi:hypothetical protein